MSVLRSHSTTFLKVGFVLYKDNDPYIRIMILAIFWLVIALFSFQSLCVLIFEASTLYAFI